MKMDFHGHENKVAHGGEDDFLGGSEMKLRKNEMKLRRNEIVSPRKCFVSRWRMKNSHGGTIISFVAIDLVLLRLLRYLPLNDQ